MTHNFAPDCKHYLGDRPCIHEKICFCESYDPLNPRILIIKLGALGDVVRTTCLLPTLKRLYPKSHITWISKDNGVRILDTHPLIDRLVTFNLDGIITVMGQKFDLVLSCDKDKEPIALCNLIDSTDKRGICMSTYGTPIPCNEHAKYYCALGLDNFLKFKSNSLTYPELIHSALGLDYIREPYQLYCNKTDIVRARLIFSSFRNNYDKKIIGVNTGSGSTYANKSPRTSYLIDLCKKLIKNGYIIALLGGLTEEKDHDDIIKNIGSGIFSTGCHNTEQQFVAIIDQCDLVITGDTLALHVGIARKVPIIALFGPTCEQEIDLYGLGVKKISKLDCSPCYKNKCNKTPNCIDSIPINKVIASVSQLLYNK